MDASVSREGWNRGKLCKLRFIFRQNDPSLCCIFVQNLGASVNTYTDSAGGDWELRYISRELDFRIGWHKALNLYTVHLTGE